PALALKPCYQKVQANQQALAELQHRQESQQQKATKEAKMLAEIGQQVQQQQTLAEQQRQEWEKTESLINDQVVPLDSCIAELNREQAKFHRQVIALSERQTVLDQQNQKVKQKQAQLQTDLKLTADYLEKHASQELLGEQL